MRPRPVYPRAVDVVGDIRTEALDDGISVVALTGEHDLGTVPQVREAFDAARAEGKSLLIDLCPTTFVDSSILGAILEVRREAQAADRGFAVACDGSAEPVRRVLEVTGLSDELPVHSSRAAAISALGGQEPA